MTPVPFELPLRPSEAGELANLIFEHAERKDLTDDLRNRLGVRAAAIKLETIEPYLGSLERDPVHRSTYYIAVDGQNGQPLLLHMALAASPASALFPKALLIGRMRRSNGSEIVINASPFGPADHRNISKFATDVNQSFWPRPQGAQPAIAVGSRNPESSLPAAFDAFRAVWKRTGRNVASVAGDLDHAGMWAAIRAGWREGYSAGASPLVLRGRTPAEIDASMETAKEAIRQAAAFSRFNTDTSALILSHADIRHPAAWSAGVIADRFSTLFDNGERGWILDEFVRDLPAGETSYRFTTEDAMRMAVKFGRSLKRNEELHDFIRRTRAARKHARSFDFEPSLSGTETLTTARELVFNLHWLKARGRAAQLAPPDLGFQDGRPYPASMQSSETGVGLCEYASGKMWPELVERTIRHFGGDPLRELADRVAELAAVLRHYQATLSIHCGSGKQAEVMDLIAAATSGRLNYGIDADFVSGTPTAPAGETRQRVARYIEWVAEHLVG